MRILIGIATYKRLEKILRCINSIRGSTHADYEITVVCDNDDVDSVIGLKLFDIGLNIKLQPDQRFVIGAWNRCVSEHINDRWDAFLGLCDDVELNPEAIEEAVKEMQNNFPDTDGVIGFKQECPGHPEYTFKWFGQTLMGRKFIERYAAVGHQIACPDYKHFYQDEEMHEYASSLGKFKNCETAILKHYHPGFVKTEMDETHNVIRKGQDSPANHDKIMRGMRKTKGYLWGKDFNLIG